MFQKLSLSKRGSVQNFSCLKLSFIWMRIKIIRGFNLHVYGKRQTSNSSWEFLKIKNEQIKIFQGTIISPKRNWKQFLCKILWRKQIALWGTWKSQIRHFHVVVVQWWQKNVQKTVLHLQSFCFEGRINPWWQTNLGWIVCTIPYNNNNSSFEAVYNIGSVWGRQSTFFKESLVVRDVYTVSYLATWESLHWTNESRNIM